LVNSNRESSINKEFNYFFFLNPLGHLAPFFTFLTALPLTHFVVSTEFVRSPRLSARPAMEGITESNSVSSFCSFAFLAASAAATTRAASAVASLASNDESVVVAESEEDAVDSPALFLALIVTE
jgi:hypothetical protein